MLPIPDFSIAARRLFAAVVPALLVASIAQAFQGNEEAGGTVTGPILRLLDAGTIILLASLILSAWLPRVAAALCVLGALLCLPNYSYGLAPGVFRWLLPGVYAHGSAQALVFAPFDIIGLLTLTGMCWTAWRTVWPPE
jgi:hypothetical protein